MSNKRIVASLKSILDNFAVLLKVWEKPLEHVKHTEMKAKIQGVASQPDGDIRLLFWDLTWPIIIAAY